MKSGLRRLPRATRAKSFRINLKERSKPLTNAPVLVFDGCTHMLNLFRLNRRCFLGHWSALRRSGKLSSLGMVYSRLSASLLPRRLCRLLSVSRSDRTLSTVMGFTEHCFLFLVVESVLCSLDPLLELVAQKCRR